MKNTVENTIDGYNVAAIDGTKESYKRTIKMMVNKFSYEK